MIAFLFPGQGSQRPGMGAPWRDHPSWELVAEASDTAGRDVAALLLDADAAELKATRNSQLATFVMSAVVLDAVERLGVEPALAAGHSLGEYTALVAAGSLSFVDGVRLVAERGEAMQDAADARTGSMAAVMGLDDDQVEVACARVDGDVWVANLNGPGQVVIAGDPDAIAAAGVAAKELGARKVLPLPVGGAFHTPLMAAARDRLRKAIAASDLRDATFPVVANVDGLPHSTADDWAGLLSAQLCSPVRWRAGLHTLADLGANTFVELGPGTVLTGLCSRTLPGSRTASVSGPDGLEGLLTALALPAGGSTTTPAGDHLSTADRLVVSPAAGIFSPNPDRSGDDAPIDVGAVVGAVNGEPVRSPFRGILKRFLAHDGERVTASQPLVWLHTA